MLKQRGPSPCLLALVHHRQPPHKYLIFINILHKRDFMSTPGHLWPWLNLLGPKTWTWTWRCARILQVSSCCDWGRGHAPLTPPPRPPPGSEPLSGNPQGQKVPSHTQTHDFTPNTGVEPLESAVGGNYASISDHWRRNSGRRDRNE